MSASAWPSRKQSEAPPHKPEVTFISRSFFFQFSPRVLPPCLSCRIRPQCTGLSFRALSASWSEELDKLDLLGINDNRPTLTCRSLPASILYIGKSLDLVPINLNTIDSDVEISIFFIIWDPMSLSRVGMMMTKLNFHEKDKKDRNEK